MFDSFTNDEFATLVQMSSWATIDDSKSTTTTLATTQVSSSTTTIRNDIENDEDTAIESTTTTSAPDYYSSTIDVALPFSSVSKLQIGRRIKGLIDLARAQRLRRSNRFSNVKLIRFTSLSVESMLLIAFR